MTCCIGKARIYYKEPLHFRLNYSGSASGSVTAPEPLTTSCEETLLLLGDAPIAFFFSSYNANYGEASRVIAYIDNYPAGYMYYPIGYSVSGDPGSFAGLTITARAYGQDRSSIIESSVYQRYAAGFQAIGWQYIAPPSNPTYEYTFKVIGAESGTVYREISGLDECPAVDNVGCVMGEENYYDTLLPDQLPGGNVESSCFKKIPVPGTDCFHVVLETKYKNLAPKTPAPPQTRSQLYLCGLPGCPAEYRIECCPEGECDPPKCPPDTDCELDCGSFVCCYKNGKVIKTIRK